MDSDYRENLLSYKRITDERCEPDSWAAITRNERFNRYSRAMHSGRLRCEKLALFLSKRITTNPPASADKQLLADQYRRVLHQFNEAFEQHRRVIASLFEPHGCEVTAISRYPLPKHLPPHNKYAALTYYHLDVQQPLCGAIHNRVSPEMLFYSTSTGDDFDERSRKLRRHQDIVRGILTETQPPLPPEDAVRERTLSVIAAVTYSVFVPACSVSDAFYTTGGSAAGAAAGAFVGSKASNNPAAPIIGAAIGGIARKPRRLSYYAKTNAEQINAQQKAYTEALLEQNGALKERIDALQKNESSIQSLQSEVERLKKELDSGKDPGQANRTGQPPRVILRSGAQRRIMSRTRSLTREKLSSFPVRKPTVRNFLSARCALNDELARALGALERRRLLNLASPFFPFARLLSLRAADDWRAIKEEDGVPTFASVVSLHNTTRKIGGNSPHLGSLPGKTGPRREELQPITKQFGSAQGLAGARDQSANASKDGCDGCFDFRARGGSFFLNFGGIRQPGIGGFRGDHSDEQL